MLSSNSDAAPATDIVADTPADALGQDAVIVDAAAPSDINPDTSPMPGDALSDGAPDANADTSAQSSDTVADVASDIKPETSPTTVNINKARRPLTFSA